MPEQNLSHLARVSIPTQERIHQLFSRLGETVSEDNLFFWDAEISNDLLDSHFTHMSEKTLENYAEDASRGVAFLRGHNWHELPLGYSLSGELQSAKGRKLVVASFYTVRGIPDADDLIKRMEAKILRDVSVGFHGGRMVCDLCGNDFWDCRHFPGLKYETKEGDTVKTELATFTIEDARLSEVSGVFDGSTPEAMIRKAQVFAAEGLLDKHQVEVLEQRYRTKLATKTVVPVPTKESRKMEENEIKELATVLGAGSNDAILSRAKEVSASLAEAKQRIAELEPQAKDGVQYRSDLIANAHLEGVRAFGNDYDKESYQVTLESAPLETIKRFTQDWKRVANATLPAGRRSEDTTANNGERRIEVVPDVAYQ